MKTAGMKFCAIYILILLACALPLQAQQISGKIFGGSPDAPIRIEVFSDFQCPSCRELYLDVMRRIVQDYSRQNKVCLIYHEFPLRSHEFSREAARYAEAASRFGRDKLRKVYDVLFLDQAVWSRDGRIEASMAKVLTPAEMKSLKKIMREPGLDASIEREIMIGNQKMVRQTPTFFIYAGRKEQKVEGRLSYIALKQFIDTH